MSEKLSGFVLEPEAINLLDSYGLPYPPHGLAHDGEQAVEIADRLGYPVVLKVVSPDVVHKSDAGGVLLDLKDADGVRRGYEKLLTKVRTAMGPVRMEGVLVCRQAAEGREVIIGGLRDAVFGPTVMFGLGGIFTEVLKDVSFRVAPFDKSQAAAMVNEIKGYPILKGARGQAECDIDGLLELIIAVSRLITERPEIKELDLNPVRLYEKGLAILDVRLMADPS